MVTGLVIGLVLGIAISAVVAFVLRRAQKDHDRLSNERAVESAYSQVRLLESELESERKLGLERQAAWDEAREQMKGEFARLSATALRESNEQLVQLAEGRFELAQQKQKGELDLHNKSIAELLNPVSETLNRYERTVRQMESERGQAYAGLVEQVKQLNDSQDRLQRETRNLVTALRAPATRGRWGELQLRRVMEMAGMLEHCDFDEQVTTESENGRLRPDVIVHLSGGRQIVVDAKVPLQAFLDANDATDEESRRSHLLGHARQMRQHVDSLSKKGYSQQFEFMPDFVVAFIPGDTLLATAMEQDPSLLEHAFERRVVLATPTSLIAVLRSIAFGWQQESLTRNAVEVQKAGRELYKRLATFMEHFSKAGRRLGDAVGAYNDAVGSLERKLLPQARRFQDLGIDSSEKLLSEPEPVDSTPRLVQAPELKRRPSRSAEDNQLWANEESEGPVRMLPLAGGDR